MRDMKFMTKYSHRLPDEILRQILLTLAQMRDNAARAITRLFRQINPKRIGRVERINRHLYSARNTGSGDNVLHIGSFLDIYGIDKSGRLIR